MTKKQMKERALLLYAFAFMQEGLRQRGILDENNNPKYGLENLDNFHDMKTVLIYKHLKRLRPTFAQLNVRQFFLRRITENEDYISPECDPLLMGLIGLYFYIRFNKTKEFVLNINSKDIEEIFEYAKTETEISDDTINISVKIITAIYPDEKGLVEFYRLTNRFPFNLLTENKKEQ